jgi:2-polyprenyl-3-methyl-5-hydroxy-6-metoxy-1,4-benzoquinol methylase
MTQEFDKTYWETHWQRANEQEHDQEIASNPYLEREIGSLAPRSALDAGCGEGAEAIWLANHGWQVTAVDISSEALARAAERATREIATPESVQWVEADLSSWEPTNQFDLVTTQYAHPAMPQLAFYQRIARWVAAGGTLLIVGHRQSSKAPGHAQGQEQHAHGDSAHQEASVTAASITLKLGVTGWDRVTADEVSRTLTDRAGRTVQLDDVVVRATRRP